MVNASFPNSLVTQSSVMFSTYGITWSSIATVSPLMVSTLSLSSGSSRASPNFGPPQPMPAKTTRIDEELFSSIAARIRAFALSVINMFFTSFPY